MYLMCLPYQTCLDYLFKVDSNITDACISRFAMHNRVSTSDRVVKRNSGAGEFRCSIQQPNRNVNAVA